MIVQPQVRQSSEHFKYTSRGSYMYLLLRTNNSGRNTRPADGSGVVAMYRTVDVDAVNEIYANVTLDVML